MRCYVKGRIKTGSDTIAIDYIEAKKMESFLFWTGMRQN